jgi:hypothetical protein
VGVGILTIPGTEGASSNGRAAGSALTG